MKNVQRWALSISYDGHPYRGFQYQNPELPTVQVYLERALAFVANHPVGVTCAGRTDAGVHASAQIVHFDTKAERPADSWVFGSNSNLPSDITVLWAHPVPQDFHARYSAYQRTYRYVIYNNPKIRHSILRRAVTWHSRRLDVERMQEAAQALIGTHDFSSFRGSDCQAKTPVRNIKSIAVKKYLNFIVVEVKANAFLHHMVRNIVGTLYPIGSGLRPVEWMAEVLDAKDRGLAGVTAAPNGLYLVNVAYEDHWGLPEVHSGPIFLPENF